MKAIATYILKGRMQASLVAGGMAMLFLFLLLQAAHPAMIMLGPLVSLLQLLSFVSSGAAVALVTLRYGVREGLLVTVGSFIAAVIFSLLSLANVMPAIEFLLVIWLPVWVLASVLRGTASLELAVNAAIGMGTLLVLVVYMLLPDPGLWWQKLLESVIPVLTATNESVDSDQIEQLMGVVASRMTGIFALLLLMGMLVSLLLARWWQSLLFNPGGLKTEFLSFKLGRASVIVLFVMLALSGMASGKVSAIGTDVFVLMVGGFLFHGLALAHGLVEATGSNTAWLFLVYVLMVIALPLMMLLMTVAGIMDSMIDFRKQIRQK